MGRRGSLLSRLTVVVIASSAASAAAEKKKSEVRADVVDRSEDFSAQRLDSEVFGWSANFAEMAVLGSNITSNRQSEQRGERFVIIFDIGATKPKQNIQVDFHTQVALPHDPVPIPDVREWMWNTGYEYPKMWPRKPRKKWFAGAMKIEPIWEINQLGDSLCQPLVGFALEWKGEKRYQPHQPLELRGDCERMRYTDHRTYWGKKDLGAVMIRFDYGLPKNEQSVRFSLSAAWALARPVRLLVRAGADVDRAELSRVKGLLAPLGRPRIESGAAGSAWTIAYQPPFLYLAHRLAAQVGGQVSADPAPPEADILLVRTSPAAAKGPPPPPRDTELDTSDCGGLLRDCDK